MLQLIQQFMPNVYRMGWSGQAGWGTAIYLTLYMTIIPFFIGGILGFIAGLLLVLTGPRGILENRLVFFRLGQGYLYLPGDSFHHSPSPHQSFYSYYCGNWDWTDCGLGPSFTGCFSFLCPSGSGGLIRIRPRSD